MDLVTRRAITALVDDARDKATAARREAEAGVIPSETANAVLDLVDSNFALAGAVRQLLEHTP